MNTNKFLQYGTTIAVVAGVVAETITMHDPHWHIETNDPLSPILYRNAPTITTSSSYITPVAGSLSFGG